MPFFVQKFEIMRAVVCTKLGKSIDEALEYLEYQTVPIPSNPSSHEVIVQVRVGALNFFDGLILQGKYQTPIKPPFIPGCELAGIVKQIGKKVTKFKIGDRVCGFPILTKGAFCGYTIALDSNLWKMPSNMNFEDAAGFVCTYGTSYMSLIQRAAITPESTVLVTAASGGVGTACLQIAKAVGCQKIIGCVGSEWKAKIAKQCGADMVINYKDTPEWSKMLKSKKIGIDVFADIVGGESWNQGMKCMNWFGKAIVIGFAGGNIQRIKANRVLLKNIDVLGVAWGATQFKDYDKYERSVSDALRMYEQGKLHPVIGKVCGSELSEIKALYMDIMNRKSVGKLLVRMNGATSKL